MGMRTMIISEMATIAIDRYTSVSVDIEQNGMTDKLREEARSYAVEALGELLRQNPDAFNYRDVMQSVIKARKATA